MQIERQLSFDVPKGRYRGRLLDVKETTRSDGKPLIRFIWDIIYPDNPSYDFKVGKNYSMNYRRDSDLLNDLRDWKGAEFIDNLIDKGKLNLNDFVTHEADLKIAHKNNKGHKRPFVHIKEIRPPGTFVKMPEIVVEVANAA